MKKHLNPRETLAWIVLAFAVFLFTLTIAYAQDHDHSRNERIKIKISREEDGKITKIDTTINSHDDVALEEIFKKFGVNHSMNFDENLSVPSYATKSVHRHRNLNKKEQEEFSESMKNLDDEMKGLHEKMKNIHIEILSDREGLSDSTFTFNFSMPPVPPLPGEDDAALSDDHCKIKIRKFDFRDSELDELEDDEHVVIVGDADELPPVFEKEVAGKHGEKAFVYKRSLPEKNQLMEEYEQDDLQLFPNPNNGKFTLNFHAEKHGDLVIKVFSSDGREVYSETLKAFTGEYRNQLDISSKGKGNYILRMTQGDTTITEKFVVE